MRDNAFAYSSNNLKHFQQPQACRPADMPHVYQCRYICSLLRGFITFQLEHQDYYIVYVQQRILECPYDMEQASNGNNRVCLEKLQNVYTCTASRQP